VSVLVAILIVALLGVVMLVVSAPLRAPRRSGDGGERAAPRSAARTASERARALERDELEAAREAKYREIRDAELDYRTGKLSRADYEAIDGELRAEAVEILNRREQLQGPVQPRPTGADAQAGSPIGADGAQDPGPAARP
jgi:hypothetical protein